MIAVQERTTNQPKATLYFVGLLDRQIWERLSKRLCREKGFTLSQNNEVVDGTLGFLKMCADHPNRVFSPSPIVDIGWHEFLMYTKEYQAFCQQVAGRFIHHSPTDIPGQKKKGSTLKNTVRFMVAHSIPFHADQWQAAGSICDAGGCSHDVQAADCNNHCENNGDCNSK
jgi:hypothetical protein